MFFTKIYGLVGLAAMIAAQGNSDFGHCDHNRCLQRTPAPAVSTVISTTTTTQTITSTATTPTGTPTPNLTIQQYLNTPCIGVPDIVNVITAGQCAATGTNNVNFGTYNPAAGCTCVVAFYYTANCSGNMVSVPPPQDPTSSQCYRYSIFFQGSVRLECTGTC
ncbi:hypothetical protein V8F06_014779 [Rhypophila decipiens]